MYPIYKFELSANGTTQRAYPIYKDDLAIDYELESNEEFYRAKLSGKLTFERNDYTFIVSQAFDTQYSVVIYISYDAGKTWAQYWTGTFWKTDCEFDDDAQTVIVLPSVNDAYRDVIAGLEKEFNLIDLAPYIVPINIDKRPMLQIYVPGQTAIGCFLSGMWWEQECESITNTSALTNKYHFSKNIENVIVDVLSDGTPTIPQAFFGSTYNPDNPGGLIQFTNGDYMFEYRIDTIGVQTAYRWSIVRVADNVRMWTYITLSAPHTFPQDVTLTPVTGTGASGNVHLYLRDVAVYARRISDVTTNTYEIPSDDLVPNNRNYTRVSGYLAPGTILFADSLSETPTKWGLYKGELYYKSPYSGREYFPIARSQWSSVSLWFYFSSMNWGTEADYRKEFTLKTAYPIWSIIAQLLEQIAPNILHSNNFTYSEFLYSTTPIKPDASRLFISPKTNLIKADYDQPAQKAPITLRSVLNMLRDCYRCYWFIDGARFRIEHISWFKNGGTYSNAQPTIGIDLTQQTVSRNGKPWAFAKNQYMYDKPDMAARYQFGWMDDVTVPFNGYPIDIISKYVNPDNIENIEIANFSSDVDYILLNSNEVSQDGFVLLAAVYDTDTAMYKLPYADFQINNSAYRLQNPYAAFIYLQRYYFYDMPATQYRIMGQNYTAIGVKRLKTQTIKFPVLVEPNLINLIKTNLGNGTIQKMSINLSSRNANATLKYDTEQ